MPRRLRLILPQKRIVFLGKPFFDEAATEFSQSRRVNVSLLPRFPHTAVDALTKRIIIEKNVVDGFASTARK